MIFSRVFKRFVEQAPVGVMARMAMERAMSAEALDELFDVHAERQYTRELLFSAVVDLMSLAVCKVEPSVHAAYQAVRESLPVTVTSLYNKLNTTEPGIAASLAKHTAAQLEPVIAEMGGRLPDLVPGHRVRIIDGNHFKATERRLKVLRGSIAGPLPGQALVILDPALMLATEMIPCEDAHAQERSLTPEILDLVEEKDVWVADRNFCTAALLSGIASRSGFFVIRQHAKLHVEELSPLRPAGKTDTAEVSEQRVTITSPDGEPIAVRRIVLTLREPTRDGDGQMAILTNLPKTALSAVDGANVYRKRWTLETLFQSLTASLEGEIDTLAYPGAALLGFSIALSAYNVLSTVQAALRAQFGTAKVNEEVSGYYLANETRKTKGGMEIAIEPEEWAVFRAMTVPDFVAALLHCAAHVQLSKYQRHPRGKKKPVPKRTRFPKAGHVSTARLLRGVKPQDAP